ncbi:MAG: ferrous iron transport protein A, partial [Clostridia bacterium]|nr:ferrous iron transport protein A [Clostridia bacterium]
IYVYNYQINIYTYFVNVKIIVYSMTIYDLKKGQSAVILNMNTDGKANARLCSLGISGGSKITILGYSLFKSSVLIGCGSVRIAVRKSIADKIEVEKC